MFCIELLIGHHDNVAALISYRLWYGTGCLQFPGLPPMKSPPNPESFQALGEYMPTSLRHIFTPYGCATIAALHGVSLPNSRQGRLSHYLELCAGTPPTLTVLLDAWTPCFFRDRSFSQIYTLHSPASAVLPFHLKGAACSLHYC